jgi:ATP-dependent DNA helicase RecG
VHAIDGDGRVRVFRLPDRGAEASLRQAMGTPADDNRAIVRSLCASEESYYLEFKSARTYGPTGNEPRDARQIARDIGEAIVAFANSEGGDLLVGIEDDGSVTGVPHGTDQLRYLQSWRQQVQVGEDGGDPSVRIADVDVDGLRVLLFRVEAHAGAALVTSDGRCMMREGARSVPVPPQRVERRRTHIVGDLAYEIQPVPQATVDDLDWDLIRRRSVVTNRREVPLDDFDDVALLRYWNLIEQRNGTVVLRRAALLLFAKEPLRWHANNRVRLRRVLGDEQGYGRRLGTQEREFLGPVIKVLNSTRMILHHALEQDSREDQLFTTSQLLPREAVDECLVNAVVHRNYAIEGQAVEVLLYPDRVEFCSPGRLPEPITINDLKAQRRVHRSRNPIMMRVLRDFGWTRDQGEGMSRIFGSMRQMELHEPELEEIADTFKVRLSTRSIYDAGTQAWIASYGPFGLQPEERRYMVALRRVGGKHSIDKLARHLDESFDQVKAALGQLERRHLVWHPKQSRSYRLVEPLNVPHERVYQAMVRTLVPTGVRLDRGLVLGRSEIGRLGQTTDEKTISAIIDQWKQAGVLAPSGAKQWKLGESFLAYVDQRSRDE